MSTPRLTVLSYQEAVGRKDFSPARKLLHDNSEFPGPIDTLHKADDYLHAIQKLSAIVEGVDTLKVFEDGNDVSLFCDLKTKVAGTSFVAEWYKVTEGKIASVRVVFDARPFAAMFAKGNGILRARLGLRERGIGGNKARRRLVFHQRHGGWGMETSRNS